MRSRSLFWSFNYAIEGIVYALRTQRNMRLHVAAAFVALAAALLVRVAALELIVVLFAIAFVLVTELINTAIEATVDVATTEGFDPIGKTAKDVAAGAVLVAALNALAVGYLVFFPRAVPVADDVLAHVRQTPRHITVAALGVTLLAVLLLKSAGREGTWLRGGWPSGHTALAFAGATAIAYVTRSGEIAVLAAGIAALVAQSRVETHAHSVPQVALGAAVGVMLTTAVFKLFWR